MNQRIQELKQQAIDYVDCVDDGLKLDHYQHFVDLKFAELIVRECCDIFVELRTRPADLAVKDVKKHFGVK